MNRPDSIFGIAAGIVREAAWAPALVIIAHWLLGGWLGHEPYVDPVMHFSGGAAAAYFFWRSAGWGRSYLGAISPLAMGVLAFGMATTAAVAWEFAEYLSDVFRLTTMQRSLGNTMRDLFLGMSGAALFVGIRWLMRRNLVEGPS